MNNNLNKIQEIMLSADTPCWVMYSAEHSDPYFDKIISTSTTVPAIAVIGPNICCVIVHELDADNIRSTEDVKVLVYKDGAGMWNCVEQTLSEFHYPPRIALTFSTMQDVQVDVLGVGMFNFLTAKLKASYKRKKRKVSFNSAEALVYAFSDRKDETELEKMRIAARRAEEILEKTFRRLRAGMSELDAVELVHKIMKKKPSYFRKLGVISEDFAWEKESCPVVLAGPSLKKGGHALASSMRITPGFTVYFDFGVKLTFKDGTQWSSDIQRMGYILRPKEIRPPADIQQMFQTLVDAIGLGMRTIRPGMKGYRIDEVVRFYITKHGYPDYNHATGHAIGALAHNPGTLLGPKSRKLSHLKIQPDAVYSMEPRIAIVNGGSIEEMIQVTHKGGIPLCAPQTSLWLIR